MGYSQVVRPPTLTRLLGGSNPPFPDLKVFLKNYLKKNVEKNFFQLKIIYIENDKIPSLR